MPLILPSNSISAVGYDVANSLRFDDGSSDYLYRSLGSQSSLRIGTFSFWIKFSQITVNRQIYSNEVENDNNRGYIQFTNTDELRIVDNDTAGDHIVLKTNAKYRDISAFYHFVIRIDTTQSTNTDRVRVYVNGVQETSFSSTTYPAQNDDLKIFEGGQTNKNLLGSGYPAGGSYIDGYISEFVYCDGQSLDPTSFGEFDEDSGIWKPIDVSGLTFGNNGFYLDFENSGSLGADVSGNGNNFTVNNLTSIDQTTDTPTLNYATLNPLEVTSGYSGSTSFTNGNTSISIGTSNYTYGSSTIGVSQGKYYMEIKSGTISNASIIGVVDLHDIVNRDLAFNSYAGGEPLGIGYFYDGRSITNDILTSYGNSWTSGDIIGVALDIDNGYIYFSKNGTWQNSGDPTSGATGTGALSLPTNSNSTGIWFFAPSVNNSSMDCNFGNPPFTISSGNSDGNGFGQFEYQPPSGYLALCTKNLATDG